jgi:hypothetical protein
MLRKIEAVAWLLLIISGAAIGIYHLMQAVRKYE